MEDVRGLAMMVNGLLKNMVEVLAITNASEGTSGTLADVSGVGPRIASVLLYN